MSCPVCYETFSNEDNSSTPRELPCGDVICSGCVLNDIFEGSYYCPECGIEIKGCVPEDIGIIVDVEQHCEEEEEYYGGCQDSSDSLKNESESGERESLFAAFTKRTSSSCIPPVTIQPEKKPSREGFGARYGVCKTSNCKNKACGSDGYCFNHSTNKKQHLVKEDELANLLARTSLDFIQINNSQAHTGFKFQAQPDDWPDADPLDLIERFKKQQRLELGEAMALINRARDVLSREPNVLKLEAPVIGVGDIHGQFYDLLNILDVGGYPDKSRSGYLFLGDYVDRGSFSCEVMLTLLAFKVAYPEKIWLIRGNHECASVSGHFGFKEECKKKYGVQLYYRFLLMFQTLPLAALVSTAYGDLFACHGGLSPDILTLEDLEEIDRFVEPEENSSLLDILWSDPISEDRVSEMTDAEYEDFLSIDWRKNLTRGCSYYYGYKAVHDFLNRNSIVSLVRAHEVQEQGFHKHFDPAMIESRIQQSAKYKRKMSNAVTALRRMNSNGSSDESLCGDEWHYPSHDIPTVITVFSAPNYCDRYDNEGAILKIDMGLDGFQFLQYSCVPHPAPDVIESQMSNQLASVIQTCPYMPTSFRDFVRLAIELGHEDSLIEEGNNEDQARASLQSEHGESHGESSAIIDGADSSGEPMMSPLKKIFSRGSCDEVSSEDEVSAVDSDSDRPTNNIPFSTKTEASPQIDPAPSSHSKHRTGSTRPHRFLRNSSVPNMEHVANAVSATSDVARSGKLNGLNENRSQCRRATESFGAGHLAHSSYYSLAHASDAINELHPVQVKKYMHSFTSADGFTEPSSKAEGNLYGKVDIMSVDSEEDGFRKRISYLTEQFDKQTEINAKKLEDGTGPQSKARRSTDAPRRSASLNFVPRSCQSVSSRIGSKGIPSFLGDSESGKQKNENSIQQPNVDEQEALFKEVRFEEKEVLALKLMFSLFDRSGNSTIGYEDLVAYGEETGGLSGIRDAADALAIVDIDGDGVIGLLDFIHFAARLRDTEIAGDKS